MLQQYLNVAAVHSRGTSPLSVEVKYFLGAIDR